MRSFPESIYFSGIGGSGVSALACFLAARGHRVVGSDRAFEAPGAKHPAIDILKTEGITIVPQDGSALDARFGLVVTSTAVEADRPEMVKARELGIPIKSRPEFLADIVRTFRSIAVAGTSGKSTTSGMMAHVLAALGQEPDFLGGGRVKGLGRNGMAVNYLSGRSDVLVFEADESDGSIVNYHPEHTVLLNLSLDHNPVAETSAMFKLLLDHTKGLKVLNADDRSLGPFTADMTTSFSIERHSDYQAKDLTLHPFGSEFTLRGVRCNLKTPGKHNVYNALAVLTLLHETGLGLQDLSDALASFQGIKRRFDIHLNSERGVVIDDYAHNPHKISALMQTVRNAIPGPVCYVFQPHGFGPTRLMKDGYIASFASGLRPADRLAVLPIFYAGGTTSRDISSDVISEGVHEQGGQAETLSGWNDVLSLIPEYRCFIVLGARDERLSELAARITLRLNDLKINKK